MTPLTEGLPLMFRPRNIPQVWALHLARRFDDLKRLPQYIDVCEHHPLDLIAQIAAKAKEQAELDSRSPGDLFLGQLKARRAS